MAQLIPLTGDARQEFRTILGGTPVEVVAWWQPSDRHWYISVASASGERIASGLRLVGDGQPLRDILSTLDGGLYVEGAGEPGRDAWSSGTHRLLFLPSSELAP